MEISVVQDPLWYRLSLHFGTGYLQRGDFPIEIPLDESGKIHTIIGELHVFEMATEANVGVVDSDWMGSLA